MCRTMKEFVAFDFETANRNRHSICSVGMVFVEDGRVADTVYELINPEEEFDWHNIQIHGITPDEVKSAPTFRDFYNAIEPKTIWATVKIQEQFYTLFEDIMESAKSYKKHWEKTSDKNRKKILDFKEQIRKELGLKD